MCLAPAPPRNTQPSPAMVCTSQHYPPAAGKSRDLGQVHWQFRPGVWAGSLTRRPGTSMQQIYTARTPTALRSMAWQRSRQAQQPSLSAALGRLADLWPAGSNSSTPRHARQPGPAAGAQVGGESPTGHKCAAHLAAAMLGMLPGCSSQARARHRVQGRLGPQQHIRPRPELAGPRVLDHQRSRQRVQGQGLCRGQGCFQVLSLCQLPLQPGRVLQAKAQAGGRAGSRT